MPIELLECTVGHLNAFDFHRFGMTHRRAHLLLKRERARQKSADFSMNPHCWFNEVSERLALLVYANAKARAEDPEKEYALGVQKDLLKISKAFDMSGLSRLLFDPIGDLTLPYIANTVVDAREETYNRRLCRCDTCNLLCPSRWMWSLGGSNDECDECYKKRTPGCTW